MSLNLGLEVVLPLVRFLTSRGVWLERNCGQQPMVIEVLEHIYLNFNVENFFDQSAVSTSNNVRYKVSIRLNSVRFRSRWVYLNYSSNYVVILLRIISSCSGRGSHVACLSSNTPSLCVVIITVYYH